jgi:nucleotide-binding universal stress UspA family protein
VEYETELIGGPAAEAIIDVARARHADEIVVGARGLGRVRALLGSVSHELLHIADRPVVVIPAAAIRHEA